MIIRNMRNYSFKKTNLPFSQTRRFYFINSSDRIYYNNAYSSKQKQKQKQINFQYTQNDFFYSRGKKEFNRFISLQPHSMLKPQKVTNPKKTENGKLLNVYLTDSAVKKLLSLMKDDNNPQLVLRIKVESGGCHGYKYIFDLTTVDKINPKEDTVFERDGAKCVLDSVSLELLQDSDIDYTTELIGSQFKVKNPYATSSCGCGTSFDIDIEKLHAKDN